MRRITSHPQSKTCRICGDAVLAKQLCSKHYQRAWHGKDPEAYSYRDANPIRVGRRYAYLGVLDKQGQLKAETIIDLDDVERVRKYKWTLAGQGRYICSTRAPGRYLHRFLLSAPTRQQVDHINGRQWDNRKTNLRLVTAKINIRNSKRSRKGNGYRRGVERIAASRKDGKPSWKSGISLYFDTKREAIAQRELWEVLRDKEIFTLSDLRNAIRDVGGWSVA